MRLKLRKHLSLVGMMATGKSKGGKALADSLGVGFVDSDERIVSVAGKEISDIFAEEGEAKFRELERDIFAELLLGEPKIIATGGGAFVQKEVRELLLAQSYVVCLESSVEAILARVAGQTDRPLLAKGNPRETLERLLKERREFYEMAHATVNTESGDVDAIVAELSELLKTVGVIEDET